MTPLEFPDKKAALLGALLNRFSIGFVNFPLPGRNSAQFGRCNYHEGLRTNYSAGRDRRINYRIHRRQVGRLSRSSILNISHALTQRIASPMREYRNHIHKSLVANADLRTKEKVLRVVPGARVIGLSVPRLRALVAEFRRDHLDLTLDSACELMDELCHDRWREEILFGIFLLGGFGKKVAGVAWERLESWTDALDNWETCDQLASQVSGAVVAGNLDLVDRLVALRRSDNPWKRRFVLATALETQS